MNCKLTNNVSKCNAWIKKYNQNFSLLGKLNKFYLKFNKNAHFLMIFCKII